MSKTIAAVWVGLILAGATAPAFARPKPESSFAPARMIEVRPGLWVGSYQCIMDLDRGGRDCSSGI
jgi:hypothetical protein